jgi:hypothetical protein
MIVLVMRITDAGGHGFSSEYNGECDGIDDDCNDYGY